MKSNAEYLRDWRRRNPDKVAAQTARHRERHKEKRAAANKAWRAANPERVAEYQARSIARYAEARKLYSRAYYATAHGRAVVLTQCAKARAAKKGLEFTLSVEWVEERVAAGRCEVTGMPFNLECASKSSRHPWAPSLDRTDPSKGYTPDNVRVVVCMYNFAKSDFSADQVMELARALVDHKVDK